nr:potassium channel family protein [Kaistia granuli]
MRVEPGIKLELRQTRHVRLVFLLALWHQLLVLWPILSGVLLVMAGSGFVVGRLEGWSLGESMYFTFVTGLTIGYGDFAPQHFTTRVLAVLIGFCGIVLTGLVAAVSVQALRATEAQRPEPK